MINTVRYQRIVGALSRSLPRGRRRIARWLARHPAPDEIEYVDTTGHRRRADLRDHMERDWFAGMHIGLPRDVLVVAELDSWTIDVGANIGIIAGQLASRTGGPVWALEPVPRNVARLVALAEDNDLPIVVFPVAVGASDGETTLRLSGEGSGYASVTASWIDADTMSVPLRSIDSLVAEHGAPGRLSLVKIDVEGFESEVLAGARRTLAEHRPRLYVEFNDLILRDAGSSSEALLADCAAIGYRPASVPELTGRVVDLLLEPE